MTSALDEAFKKCEAKGRIAFVPYLTAGYPTKADTVQLMLALEKGGADVIELGESVAVCYHLAPCLMRRRNAV